MLWFDPPIPANVIQKLQCSVMLSKGQKTAEFTYEGIIEPLCEVFAFEQIHNYRYKKLEDQWMKRSNMDSPLNLYLIHRCGTKYRCGSILARTV
uniref:Uncharacterized protein n=1 Tax=Scherffelia dubia TaxID=3190 RepID=A0A142BYH3_SCHDU|nr:hypothetical protein [Scherffelia dubia]YP_009241558.1 hypothetical protein [Scherffelia dubia]AMP43430.1 hypothetical protein [Scherffelia dubia]AMP43465.1 hypothetical protein [Scherffelia dubia]